MLIPIQDCLKQSGAYALAPIFRIHKDILDKDNGSAVSNGPDDAEETVFFICSQHQQRALKALPESLRVLRIGDPAGGGIQAQDFFFVILLLLIRNIIMIQTCTKFGLDSLSGSMQEVLRFRYYIEKLFSVCNIIYSLSYGCI